MTGWNERTRAEQALIIVRVGVAAILVIHGSFRVISGGVSGFGEFLGSQGLPAGVAIAWALTVVEIVGGLTLAAGWQARRGRALLRPRGRPRLEAIPQQTEDRCPCPSYGSY